MEYHSQNAGNHLTDDRSKRRADYSHLRDPEQAVDHYRVEDDVGNGSRDLRYRGEKRPPGSLEGLFKHREEDYPE